MKIARTLHTRHFLGATLLVLSGWLIALPAQAQDNGVYNASNTVVGSPAFIDASTFSGSDICAKINSALTTSIPAGGVVDARGIVPSGGGAQICTTNPFNNVSVPSTLLLPGTTINICFPWILPDHTRVIGTGRQTVIYPVVATAHQNPCGLGMGIGFQPDAFNALVEMGYYGDLPGTQYAPCPNQNVCTGVSIEHIKLASDNYPTTTGLNGIYNGNSQDLSYVDDVNLYYIGLKGIWVSAASSTMPYASGAANSGPYSRINFTGASCNTSGCHPVCVDIETQTRGLHGITCIGDSSVISPGHSGILVNASNNSVEDVHLEGFWDGIRIGDTSGAVGNIAISNVTAAYGGVGSGPVQNAVHICGSYQQTGNPLGACSNQNTSVTDVSVLQIKNVNANSCSRTDILDDVTGTIIATNTSNYDSNMKLPLGMYFLGEETVSNGTSGVAPGYSRFSTSPSISVMQAGSSCVSYQTSAVPTWGVGGSTNPNGGTCSTPGALFSYTSGGSMSSVFVCSGGYWKPIA